MSKHRLVTFLATAALASIVAIPPILAGANQVPTWPAALSERRETRAPFSSESRTGIAADRLLKRAPKPPTSTRMLVKLAPKVSRAKFRAAGPAMGYRVVEALPELGWAVIQPIRPSVDVSKIATRAKGAGLIQRAAKESWIQPAARPTDPLFAGQWGFENTGQTGGLPGADSRSIPAWKWSKGSDVVVAVSDTGVDFSHPDLAGQQWVNSDEIPGNGIDDDGNGKIDDMNGWDFLRSDATVFDAADGDKHGTHVAATIAAASDNGQGGAGTAPSAKIMAVKFLGRHGGSDTAGAASIVYAVNEGADVINASWGGGYSAVISDAITYAAQRGVLVVCAAGNAGRDNDVYPSYPASDPATNVVSVAALTATDGLASFSNRGATSVDLGAPGAGILSAQPIAGASLLVEKSPYRVVYHAFPLEKVTDTVVRNKMIVQSVDALAESKAAQIMIVDDSWATVGGEAVGARSSVYTNALAQAGYSSVQTWRTDVSGPPTATTMSGKVVIWFTGASSYAMSPYESYGTLSATERTALASYLDGGGRLLLASGDTGYDMNWIGGSALSFYQTYLHSTFVDDDPWTGLLRGKPNAILGVSAATVADPLRYSDGSDCIAAFDGYASVIADWDGYATISGTSMAAPHVTGTVALMRSRMQSASAAALKSQLLSTVRPLVALSGKTVTGGALDMAAAVGQLAAPSDFTATAGTAKAVLTWSNSADSDFAKTRILAKVDGSPTGPDDPAADIVYEGTGTRFEHGDLQIGAPIYYAAFSVNAFGAWSQASYVQATPLAPLTKDDAYTMRWNREMMVPVPGVLGNDTQGLGAVELVTATQHGQLTLRPDGSFTYRPATGYFGNDLFTYSVSGGVRSETAQVTIDVRRFRLDALSEPSGWPGKTVTLTGTGFGGEQGTGYVSFGGVRAQVVSWSDTSIAAVVPSGIKPAYVGVSQDGVMSNGLWFKPVPRLNSLSAQTGQAGDLVTFTGSGFGVVQGTGTVSFAGASALVLSWTDTEVVAAVPAGLKAGYAGVCQNGVMSNGLWFAPAKPVLDSLSSGNGAAGTSVTFTGKGFGATQSSGYVTFAGTRAEIVSWSDTSVVAVVPAGASAGYSGVTQYGWTSNGKYFVPFAGPQVTSLSEVSAAAGTIVTIEGVDFGSVQGAGWVTFGGTSATVLSWTDTSVTVSVPLVTSPVYVGVVQNGICSNGKYFVPKL